ncbi:exodeoxyribonuclease VII small subunit [Acidithiobacillus sp. MC6.1]|nr:exodeoxyribonuclease VII small subunit [Acidithiobacillus sp. MC6.1]
MSETSESFQKNFVILKEVALTLRNQKEPDIDSLVPLVEKATAAYQACMSRIDAVEKMLESKLNSVDRN